MYIDIFLILFIVIGTIQGFHRGLVRTIFAILSVLIAFLATLKFGPYVVSLFERVFGLSPMIALIVGLILTFLILMIGIRWLGKGLESTLKLAKINIFNKLLGALLFAILMIITYSAILWFVNRTNLLSEGEKARSQTYPIIREIPAKTGEVIQKMKPVFKEFWEKMDAAIEQIKHDENLQEG